MSAAFDHATAPDPVANGDDAPQRRLTVAPLTVPEDVTLDARELGADAAEAELRVAELQRHLANLARRYADDAVHFQQRIERAHEAADTARADARRANQRAAAAQAETFRLRGDCAFLSERLTSQRVLAGRLEDAATLPWYAVARRRLALRELGISRR